MKDMRVLLDSTHESEVLRQCQTCGAWWFYRFHEYVSYDKDDEITQWYTVVTEEEAATVMRAKERPDLSFLAKGSGFMIDAQGVQRVDGQPTYPWGH